MKSAVESDALERMLERLEVGAFHVDHASGGRVTWANDACARILGVPSASDVIGRKATDFYADPKERSEIEARLLASETFRTTGVARLEVRRMRLDTGEPVPVTLGICATFDERGRIAQMDCTIERMREHPYVEKAFRASEERFRTMFDASTVGMTVADLGGRLQRVNAAFCRLVGRRDEELLGIDALSLVHPEDRRERPTLATHPEGSTGRELRLVRADGGTVRCVVSFSWLLGEDGAPHSSVATLQDVTELRQSEQRLQRLDRLESLGVLAGGIAHDFNNILAVILGNLSVAARLPDAGPRTRAALVEAEDASKRARELAQQLVTFAKGGTPIKRIASIAAIVREAAGFYLRGSNVAVDLAIPDDLWLSELDPAQMSQVLQNLFINAVQAMPNGGTVHVDAENVELTESAAVPLPAGRYVRIRVRDEGVGIPSKDLDRVFDPYFSTKDGGTGLGLATAYSIVLRHGGHLRVESTPGEGATFSVWLVASESTEVATAPERTATRALPRARILLMDDEAGVRRLAARILGARGLEVDAVANGHEAIAAYASAIQSEKPYDAVILDLTVPGGLGGVETLERLRALDQGVRAIVSSGYSAAPVMADCRAYGFAAAVPKPYTASELESVVLDVLGR